MKLFSAGLCRDYPERPAIVGNGYRCTAVLLNYSASVEEAADLLAETGTGFLLCGDNAAIKKDPDALSKLASLAKIPAGHCMDIRPETVDLCKTAQGEGEGICVAVPLFHILGLLMSYSYLCRCLSSGRRNRRGCGKRRRPYERLR